MDKWKESELAKMKVGGNQKARVFFENEEEGNLDKIISTRENFLKLYFRLGHHVDPSKI